MHFAAMSPKYLKKDAVPVEDLQGPNPTDFLKQYCLLDQPFVKDPKITIQDYLNSLIAKIGENIFVNRFVRFKVGESE